MATPNEPVQFPTLEQQVSAVTAKVDTFIGEMRDRDNQRAAEIQILDEKINSLAKQINDT